MANFRNRFFMQKHSFMFYCDYVIAYLVTSVFIARERRENKINELKSPEIKEENNKGIVLVSTVN